MGSGERKEERKRGRVKEGEWDKKVKRRRNERDKRLRDGERKRERI